MHSDSVNLLGGAAADVGGLQERREVGVEAADKAGPTSAQGCLRAAGTAGQAGRGGEASDNHLAAGGVHRDRVNAVVASTTEVG